MRLDADIAQAVLEITERLGGKTNWGFISYENSVFAEESTSELDPAPGEGADIGGQVTCLPSEALPGQHACLKGHPYF